MLTAIIVLGITVSILLIILLSLTEQVREATRKNRMYADKYMKMITVYMGVIEEKKK